MATPYGPPRPTSPVPPVPARRGRQSVVGPLILILIGGVFLCENLGILPRNTWVNLWRLWPAILVLVGIELLIGQRVPWLTLLALGLVVIGVSIGAMAFTGFAPAASSEAARARTFDTDLEGAQQAAVTVRFGAGELDIGPMATAEPGRLATMIYEGTRDEGIRPQYMVVGGVGRLEYRSEHRGGPQFGPFFGTSADASRMAITLNPAVPITSLIVSGGATEAQIDLSRLVVNSLDVQVGAATTEIRLPETGLTNVHISGGAATINLQVPEGVAAQIRHRGGLSTLEVNEARFPPAGDNMYRSPDYETAANKVDITLETGVTTIEID